MSGALDRADGEGPNPWHEFVLLGARLAGAVRWAVETKDRTEVDAVLADVPEGQLEMLTLALAAMVPEDRTPGQLLDWSLRPPPKRRRRRGPLPGKGGRHAHPREHGTERGYQQHRHRRETICGECTIAHRISRRPVECREAFWRLVEEGVAWEAAADATTPGKVAARTHVLRLADRRGA